MGLFEKIKNALFEEEYVEIEEKPKKPKKEIIKKDVERPIAKKVLLPKKEEVKIEELDEAEYLDEDFEIQPKREEIIPETFEDNEPEVLEEEIEVREERGFRQPEPSILKVFEKEEPVVKEDVHYYQPKKEKTPYGIDSARVTVSEYGRSNDSVQYSSSGLYERKEERTHFKPSPIISPIYGILDKNYKKEDVVTKKEVRLTSSYAKENLSVDDVRKKAYGSLSDDIASSINEPVKVEAEVESTFEVEHHENENLLVDLSNDKEKPAVKEVTMGDALEYFEDLGLEYNVDYVDASKDRAMGRRSKEDYDDVPQITQEIPIVDEKVEVTPEEKPTSIDSDDNLFDLIDSMYKEND